jgi:DnaJ-class molecular chaperone
MASIILKARVAFGLSLFLLIIGCGQGQSISGERPGPGQKAIQVMDKACNGKGYRDGPCPNCFGRGVVQYPVMVQTIYGPMQSYQLFRCNVCGGNGHEICRVCDGKGRITKIVPIDSSEDDEPRRSRYSDE